MKLQGLRNKIRMTRNFLISSVLLISPLLPGQSLPDSLAVPEISWECKAIARGVLLKSVETQLFNSFQAIYVVDIDTTMAEFEFGVAGADSTLITSLFAPQAEALAAINGTFFNIKEEYNVHYVRVDDSVIAVTDEKEFGVRATGIFTSTGEEVDIASWGPEQEDATVMKAEDAIVSGPLLIDDGADLSLEMIGFNTHRHPRSLVGATPDGHILFVVVDGRQPGYAEGMSLFELRSLAWSLGCTDALNLDGGGSSTLYVAGEGSNGVVNRPSGKDERPVPSILFIRNNKR
jgi:exopolysaccharide biosynthesis protein